LIESAGYPPINPVGGSKAEQYPRRGGSIVATEKEPQKDRKTAKPNQGDEVWPGPYSPFTLAGETLASETI
jgi:hypothetical protein